MLQQGRCNDRQIVPADWIARSTEPYSEYVPSANLHYGMLWVVRVDEEGRMTSFHHTGLGMHFLGVYPSGNLVIVHRVDNESDHDFRSSDLPRLFGVLFGG